MTTPMDGLTLAVTSSTGVMSLALGRVGAAHGDAELLAEVTVATERRHAEEITPRLGALVADAGLTLGHLDRLVVDIGPGRFTGLRVGLATVRALAFALDRPVVPLTSLAVLAASADQKAETTVSTLSTVTAVIDARRSEVFQQTFRDGVPVGPPLVVGPEEGAANATGLVVGDGLDRYLDVYQAVQTANPTPGVELRAGVMVAMSAGLEAKPGSDITPLYLRDPDAVPNIKTRAPA